MDPQATAGRIVHYHDYTTQSGAISPPRAAMVNVETAADGRAPELTLFTTPITKVLFSVPYSEDPAGGCWTWMPYQKAKAETPEDNVSESAEPRP